MQEKWRVIGEGGSVKLRAQASVEFSETPYDDEVALKE